jgi:integrase
MQRRSSRVGFEDRWHRTARKDEQVHYPADGGAPTWCMDPRHGTQGTLVCTTRHGRGKRWLVRWVGDEGQERAQSFDRKSQAQAHVAEITTRLTTGSYADPHRGATTFDKVATDWLASKVNLKPKTKAGYVSVLETVVLPKWGGVKLRDLDQAAIQQWVSWLATHPEARTRKTTDKHRAGLSSARVIHAHQVVHQVLRYAVRSKLIAVNPAADVELPRRDTKRDRALSADQVAALADAAADGHPMMRVMVYALAYGGMRYGELAALRVRDVNLQRRRLHVARSVTAVAKQGQVETGTKTHQERMTPIPKFLADMLNEHVNGRGAGERLFPHHDGGPIPLDWFAWRFQKACEAIGLEGVTPKTLRHTAGSLALEAGASLATTSQLLGHKTPYITASVYSHSLPDGLDTLAAEMDKMARAAGSRREVTPREQTWTWAGP